MRENKCQSMRYRFFESKRPDNSPLNFICLVLDFFPTCNGRVVLKQLKRSHKITQRCLCDVHKKTALAKQHKHNQKSNFETKLQISKKRKKCFLFNKVPPPKLLLLRRAAQGGPPPLHLVTPLPILKRVKIEKSI